LNKFLGDMLPSGNESWLTFVGFVSNQLPSG